MPRDKEIITHYKMNDADEEYGTFGIVKEVVIEPNTFVSYIEKQIYRKYCNYIQDNGKKPTAIILNIYDFQKLDEELCKTHRYIHSVTGEFKYNGMLIYRSRDVVHGEIIVLGN